MNTECPRCGRVLIRSHDTGFCLVHGTVVEPRRLPWDAVEAVTPAHRFVYDERCRACGRPTFRARLCASCMSRATEL